METAPPWFTGQLLLALPGIGDPRFEHSVIAMISHDAEGAMGIGIADPIEGMTVGAVLDQLEIAHDGDPLDQPVFLGGPVEQSRGFVIHSSDWGGEGAVQVADRWTISSSHDILRAIGEGRGPSRWLVALGYAGWAGGQLEDEMVRHGWHVTPGSDALLFDTPPEKRWQAAFAEAGIDARLLTTEGGEA
ncbi:YqgE/AlgH family protein [Sphingopyxis sp. KK2]|uniref:YqgE/AlgH family protein n=1 Tax=Sphingopyxis sp. KK2 TaxID=1855727 RepID=UPI00097E58E3|nr:YqgE/AlgH family protein [Sphingopyxis sp. KK2]